MWKYIEISVLSTILFSPMSAIVIASGALGALLRQLFVAQELKFLIQNNYSLAYDLSHLSWFCVARKYGKTSVLSIHDSASPRCLPWRNCFLSMRKVFFKILQCFYRRFCVLHNAVFCIQKCVYRNVFCFGEIRAPPSLHSLETLAEWIILVPVFFDIRCSHSLNNNVCALIVFLQIDETRLFWTKKVHMRYFCYRTNSCIVSKVWVMS